MPALLPRDIRRTKNSRTAI